MHTYARRSLMTVWLTAVMDYRESPVLARPLGVGLRSRARRGSHCPVVVVSTYAERRGVHRYMLMNLWIVVGFGRIKGLWWCASSP